MANCTQFFPPGWSDHGDPRLLCRPARDVDVLVFLLGNYFAHAGTTMSIPGESIFANISRMAAALCYPSFGVYRACRALYNLAILGKTDLQIAARAGALCMVVRDDVELSPKQERGHIFATKIQGRIELPDGYHLKVVPPNSKFEDDPERHTLGLSKWIKTQLVSRNRSRTMLAYNYNFIKIAVALVQTVVAALTLYQTRGDQLQRYGLAAFGLTVTPYLCMSVLNLLAHLVCPEFPAMYLVETEALREIRRIHLEKERQQRNSSGVDNGEGGPMSSCDSACVFQSNSTLALATYYNLDSSCPVTGVVGKLAKDFDPPPEPLSPPPWRDPQLFLLILSLGLCFTPLIIIGSISGFQRASSTDIQLAWTIIWLASGSGSGLTAWKLSNEARLGYIDERKHDTWFFYRFCVLILYTTPCIGGLVVVAYMIKQYGVCTRIA